MLDISRGITTLFPVPSDSVERAINEGKELEVLYPIG